MFYPDDYRFMTLEELEKYKRKGIVYTQALVPILTFPEKQGEEKQEADEKHQVDENPMIATHQLEIQTLHSR